jgi:hypothetical protein
LSVCFARTPATSPAADAPRYLHGTVSPRTLASTARSCGSIRAVRLAKVDPPIQECVACPTRPGSGGNHVADESDARMRRGEPVRCVQPRANTAARGFPTCHRAWSAAPVANEQVAAASTRAVSAERWSAASQAAPVGVGLPKPASTRNVLSDRSTRRAIWPAIRGAVGVMPVAANPSARRPARSNRFWSKQEPPRSSRTILACNDSRSSFDGLIRATPIFSRPDTRRSSLRCEGQRVQKSVEHVGQQTGNVVVIAIARQRSAKGY